MISRLLTPLFYAALLIPMFVIILTCIKILDATIGLPFNGLVELPIILITIGTVVFWYANKAMSKLEKNNHPKIIDHLRQSLLYYIGLIYGFAFFASYGFTPSLGSAYMIIGLANCLWPIIVNGIFLIRQKKLNNQ